MSRRFRSLAGRTALTTVAQALWRIKEMRLLRQWPTRRLCLVAVFASAAATILAPLTTAGLISSCALTPGRTCTPPDNAGDSAGTLLATTIDPFSYTTGSGLTHGAIKAEVFAESGGTLDFYYIIFNAPDSATAVSGAILANFFGWTTSVAFRSDGSSVTGFVNGNIAPSSASLDPAGSIVGFTFGAIPQNERSRVFVVSTNAPAFVPGSMVVDGSSPLATFQPAVPEPASLCLLGAGLVLFAARRLVRERGVQGMGMRKRLR